MKKMISHIIINKEIQIIIGMENAILLSDLLSKERGYSIGSRQLQIYLCV